MQTIRRPAEFPARNFHFDENYAAHLQRVETVTIPPSTIYEMRWGWTNWSRLYGDMFNPDTPIRHRLFRGVIFCNGLMVGAVRLEEFDTTSIISRRHFYDCMDAHTMETASLGGTICGIFTEDEFGTLIDLGSILYWDAAWMHPDHAKGAIWARLTNQVIGRMRGYAVLVLKAFPLEYQSAVDPPVEKAFQHRRRAMMRYYQRVLRVEPVKRRRNRTYGTPDIGWMMRWHPNIVREADRAPIRLGLADE